MGGCNKVFQHACRKNNLFFLVFLLLYGNVQAQSLIVGTSIDPPLVYHNEEGKLTGATVELIQEAARRLEIEVSTKIFPWKRALYLAEKGANYSICCAGRTEERLKYLYFPSVSITSEENVFFIKKGIKINFDENLKDFSKINLGIISGYVYASIQDAIENGRFKSVQPVTTIDQNLKKLLAERIDVFIGNKLVVIYNLKKLGMYDKVEIVKKPGGNEDWIIDDWPVYWAFSKKGLQDPSYMEKVSQVIQEMKADGTYKNILSKYE